MARRGFAVAGTAVLAFLSSCGGTGVRPSASSTAAVRLNDPPITSQANATISPPATNPPANPTATRPPVNSNSPATNGADPNNRPAPNNVANAIRFSTRSFVDPAANGVTAISVLVPFGWQASGGVQWLPLWARLAYLQTRVFDPNSGLTIDWLPIQNFISFTPPAGFDVPTGGNYQGKAFVAPITDPVDFVRQFWIPNDLAELGNAQVQSVVEVPKIAQEFLTGFGGPGEAHAYRIRYGYFVNGQPWERDVSFALLFSASNGIVSWFVNFASTAAAPRGVLDSAVGVISTIVASRVSTPEWEANYRIVTRLFYQGLQQQMADTVAFGRLLTQYREESARLQQQVTAERQASQDHQAQVFRETLGGVQTFDDPVNRTPVQLPLGWNTYWVNQRGEYIAADPGFDPNSLNDGFWQQLRARP